MFTFDSLFIDEGSGSAEIPKKMLKEWDGGYLN
jgi:hypothetical protein